MKYYILKINDKMVRSHELYAYDFEDTNLYCSFTEDINLAEKYTESEYLKETGEIMYILGYLRNYNSVDIDTKIESWEFISVDL